MAQHIVNTAVIPVAGLGTRFLPATKAIPKELLPLGDKPVLQYIVEEAVESGIERVIFITSPDKAAIERYFSPDIQLQQFLQEKGKEAEAAAIIRVTELAEFIFIPQHAPLGLGHAVLQAQDIVGNEPFIVFGGDDVIEATVPVALQLIQAYEKHHGSVIGVMEVPEEAVSRYGIVAPKEEYPERVMKIQDIIEKPATEDAPSPFAAAGRWLLTPEIFAVLEHTPPSTGGEVQLTDAIKTLIASQDVYAKVYDGIYRDCGNKLEYMKAVISFGLQNEQYGSDIQTFIDSLHS